MGFSSKFNYLLIILSFFVSNIEPRKHNLILKNDSRKYFSISTFGFFVGGHLDVHLKDFTFLPNDTKSLFGFTLTRTHSDSVSPYMENHQDKCLLQDQALSTDANIDLITFFFYPEKQMVQVNCSKFFTGFKITHDRNFTVDFNPRERRNIGVETSDTFLIVRKKRDETSAPLVTEQKPEDAPNPMPILPSEGQCPSMTFPMHLSKGTNPSYNLRFHIYIENPTEEGLYSLYFHNCGNYGKSSQSTNVNISLSLIEVNADNFLSAGEIPLPRLYFMMSLVFFTACCVWLYILHKKGEETFKIHYLMGLLVFLKSASLMFHGINYYFIAKDGYPMEAWAVLYYIAHLLKGALLFITIVLIGTGWAFIKHILSDQDKKIFMIVIPLQVLANVAKIIMEESEEGEIKHSTWKEIFIFVDLLCCGAILFPVVWSIRHLQEASQTDGKAAINLEKLKLFRHFYIMIVCYVYFTRIIVFLLKITVPFQFEWLDEFFREVATLIFFILTGYNFRPTPSNPYFRLSSEDDQELDEVLTQTGLTENISKSLRSREDQSSSANPASKRESSHEYD